MLRNRKRKSLKFTSVVCFVRYTNSDKHTQTHTLTERTQKRKRRRPDERAKGYRTSWRHRDTQAPVFVRPPRSFCQPAAYSRLLPATGWLARSVGSGESERRISRSILLLRQIDRLAFKIYRDTPPRINGLRVSLIEVLPSLLEISYVFNL